MSVATRHENNFDFLRLLAATCIAFTHSFGLLGRHDEEYLVIFSDHEYDFSHFGLCIFFTISGYLIAKSATTSPTFKNFVWKRLLRIQPMLILVCMLSVLLLGPSFTKLDHGSYFKSITTWTYFRNIMPVFGLQFSLPGVFTNLSDTGVNGSLWTLIVEERLYIIVGLIMLFKARNKHVFITTVILLNIFFLIHHLFYDSRLVNYLNEPHMQYAFMFLNAGLLFHLNVPFKKRPMIFFLTGLTALLLVSKFLMLVYLWIWVIPICILGFAYLKNFLNKTGVYGDFTYGIYVFTFPVQQMIIATLGPAIAPLTLFMICLLICIPMAILSWHLLEKKCLSLKERVL